MNLRQRKTVLASILLVSSAVLYGCGPSELDMEIQLDEAYEQGYWDALNCVKRKGGSAGVAANDCEDE